MREDTVTRTPEDAGTFDRQRAPLDDVDALDYDHDLTPWERDVQISVNRIARQAPPRSRDEAYTLLEDLQRGAAQARSRETFHNTTQEVTP